MSKLMELVEEYGSRQLACGVMHMPSGAMKSGELLSEIRAAVAELERDRSALLDALQGLVACIQETRGPSAYAALIQAQRAIDAAMEAAHVPER